jgi:hypothetical protein
MFPVLIPESSFSIFSNVVKATNETMGISAKSRILNGFGLDFMILIF